MERKSWLNLCSYSLICYSSEWFISLLYLKGKRGLWDYHSVCLYPYSNKQLNICLWNSVRWPRRHTFWFLRFIVYIKTDVHVSEMGANLAPLSVSPWHLVCSYVLKGWRTSNKPFLKRKNTSVESGWKLKLIFCFMETTHRPLYLDMWTLLP
jgi:hypothetical protein